MMPTTLWVALGGALGSVGRYWIGLWMAPISRDMPWSTMLINVAGSFAISFFGVLTMEQGRYPTADVWRAAFMVGVCGGFTTFSSFSLQTLELIRAGAPGRAMLNIGLSVVLCLMAVALGHLAASRINADFRQKAEIRIEEEIG